MADVPADLKYTKDHEWARIEGHRVTVGITQHAVDAARRHHPRGSVDVKVGRRAHRGKALRRGGVREVRERPVLAHRRAPSLRSTRPWTQPEKVNEAPYGDGWMVVIETPGTSALDGLMDASAYSAFLGTLYPSARCAALRPLAQPAAHQEIVSP
jgi:glycine cleavage system H protein